MMKNYLAAFIVFICLSPLTAQIEFAPVGATYHYLRETQLGTNSILTPSILETVVTGDTIINSQPCRILQGEGMNWPCNNELNKIYIYSDNGRVYYFHHGTGTFDLLYDFNKNTGESWDVPAFCQENTGCGFDQNFTVLVDSVTYKDLNGFSVKVQHTSLFNADGIIDYAEIHEGIGDIDHMFFEEPWHCTTAHDWIRGLRCYDSPVDGLFAFFEDEGSCDMVVSTREIERIELQVSVLPNPTRGQVTVKVPGYFDWFLYDIHGKLLDFRFNNYQEFSLNLDHLHKGIYFFKIEQANNISVKRVIKQ